LESDQVGQFAFARTDEALDQNYGDCWMRRPEVAGIVSGALKFFDGNRYDLHAWCVMPNHVHALFTPRPAQKLDRILHSWKSYSATKANPTIGKTGAPFWEHESYDRLVRSAEEFVNVRRYILVNPEKAGLRPWPWVGCEDDRPS
jgi:Transposase and inactivated derivatives